MNTFLSGPEALRLVLQDGARVRRAGWDSEEYRRARGHSDGTRYWIGALTNKHFGVETRIYSEGFREPLEVQGKVCGGTGFILYFVAADTSSHIHMGWSPPLDDLLANDWLVVEN